jgi:hypothetical protein
MVGVAGPTSSAVDMTVAVAGGEDDSLVGVGDGGTLVSVELGGKVTVASSVPGSLGVNPSVGTSVGSVSSLLVVGSTGGAVGMLVAAGSSTPSTGVNVSVATPSPPTVVSSSPVTSLATSTVAASDGASWVAPCGVSDVQKLNESAKTKSARTKYNLGAMVTDPPVFPV